MSSNPLKYHYRLRLRLIIMVSCALLGLLAVRIVYIQTVKNAHFSAVADAQRKHASELAPTRGTIYMSDGRGGELFPVASNTAAWVAFAVPREMDDSVHVAETLAPALVEFRKRQQARIDEIVKGTGQHTQELKGESTPDTMVNDEDISVEVTQERLLEKFQQRTDPYEPFLRPYEVLDDELRSFLDEAKLTGITLEEQSVRVYPEKTLAAHILGYVGFESERRVGKYGIEGFFDKDLRGSLGWLSLERDASGRYIGVGSTEFLPAEDGADVVLTIDRVVQSYIEREIEDGVKKYGAERGSIIVMDPKTGAILGMATYPTYDPNTYYAVTDVRVQTNPVISEIFEPGSILKPIVMASAVDGNIVEPGTTFADRGPVKVAEYTIDTYDGKHYGIQTMTQVLEKSNNVGMVWVAQQVGKDRLYEYLRRFGLGERTGIELDGETQTTLKGPHDWNITTVATVGFGQGIALTPLQALNAINSIANEGMLMQPYIVSRVRSSNGTVDEMKPVAVRSVVSKETSATVSAMMVSVIENGVATLARVPGYYVAGKTGTAQVPDERGKYSKDRKIISFVGFGPVDDPRFSILIKLDNPAGLSLASGTAAPMFKNLAEKLLNYYQVPPSYDVSVKQPAYKVPE